MHLDGQWISQHRAEMIERRKTELTVVDESGLSSQRATESFGNEQRRLKLDSGCFGDRPLSNEPLRSSIAWMALWCETSVPGRSGRSPPANRQVTEDPFVGTERSLKTTHKHERADEG
jgi:hypothetical protein